MTNITPLDTFRVLCPFVDGINVQEDFINYRFEKFNPALSSYMIREARKIISDNELPLNATLSGLFKNVLHITENKKL